MLKAPISVLLTLVGVLRVTAQTSTPTSTPDTVYLAAVREFARDMVQDRRALADSTSPFFLEDSIDPGSGYDFLTSCLQDSSFFTLLEREQIKRWAARPSFWVWTPEMVPGVKPIPEDTITAIFSWKHGDGWKYFNLHYGQGFHSFGCPLFLRNCTWCLFYSGYHCGWLCGGGQLALYKKEGGRWVFVKNWGEWMS
jgi:hypothetical protein